MASLGMSTSTPVTRPPVSSSTSNYVHQAQEAMQADQRARQSIIWSAFNTVAFAVVLYDLTESCYSRPRFVDYIEFVLLCIFLLNIIYHLINYLTLFLSMKPVPLTENQKMLLGVHKADVKFPTLKPQPKPAEKLDLPKTPLNLSAASWLNSSILSSPNTTAGSSQTPFMSSPSLANASLQTNNFSMSSPSWPGTPQSPNLSLSSSWVYQPNNSPATTSSRLPHIDEPITDEESLSKYLRKCEAYDKKVAAASPNLNSSPSNLSLLWSSPINSNPASDLPTSTTYHLAPVTLPQDAGSPGSPGFDSGAANAICVNEELWRREGVSVECLSSWNKNLRQWLTATVIERVKGEIDTVNSALQKLGLTDDRVGTSGLERIKKTAQMSQVAQLIPSMAGLIPFLEVTTHQDYLVSRIKELAKGGSMSNFRWNSGGNFNNKPWEEHLPTDSAIVMHMLASYLDLVLPPLMHQQDWRPFSSVYLCKADQKPNPKKGDCFIHQARVNPPHYILYWKSEVLEVNQGCNNFLHTVLLFLHRLRTQDHSMLGRMNLGPSGLNLLWVIDG